ncbi:unnamed protein product [Peronospora effusa]|nr:unnamed protein product [Peronospora effusa]
MGRKHIYYLNCEQGQKEKCVYSGNTTDQRHHCTRALKPKQENEMNEVLHEQIWKTLVWEDSCTSKMELELFGNAATSAMRIPTTISLRTALLLRGISQSPSQDRSLTAFFILADTNMIASTLRVVARYIMCSYWISRVRWTAELGMILWLHERNTSIIVSRMELRWTWSWLSPLDNYAQVIYEAQTITTMTIITSITSGYASRESGFLCLID